MGRTIQISRNMKSHFKVFPSWLPSMMTGASCSKPSKNSNKITETTEKRRKPTIVALIFVLPILPVDVDFSKRGKHRRASMGRTKKNELPKSKHPEIHGELGR